MLYKLFLDILIFETYNSTDCSGFKIKIKLLNENQHYDDNSVMNLGVIA